MMRRSPLVRYFTIAWAALQMAAPAIASIADGQATLANASTPKTHIEATTSDICPRIDSPDCGLCRYLTTSLLNDVAAPGAEWTMGSACERVESASFDASSASVALPFGRAPPTV